MGKTIKSFQVQWAWTGDPARILGWNVVLGGSATDPYAEIFAQVFVPRPTGSYDTWPNPVSTTLRHVLVTGGVVVHAWVQQVYREGDSDWVSEAQVTAADDGIASADEINESATRKWAGESGADVTANNTAADTANVAGTAAATVRDNAANGATFTSSDAGALAYLSQVTDMHIQDGAVTAAKLASAIAYSGRFEAKGGDGVTKAGMAGGDTGDNAIRLWAGASYANRSTAPFRVTQGGKVYASDVEISGTKSVSWSANHAGPTTGSGTTSWSVLLEESGQYSLKAGQVVLAIAVGEAALYSPGTTDSKIGFQVYLNDTLGSNDLSICYNVGHSDTANEFYNVAAMGLVAIPADGTYTFQLYARGERSSGEVQSVNVAVLVFQ
ncbi:hypothetical protein [Deferrisoma camini]|uniref:hypothetical protein n=1 Tax=Deferrisoma camini TaxID=1035120 RepID=UPI00046D1250|nr:hypothetical protein [Deferrisoma camini]